MDCQQASQLLHAYLDGELDAVHNVEIKSHLQSCRACGAAHEQMQSLRRLVDRSELAYRAPVSLRQRVRSQLHHTDSPRIVWWQQPRRLMALAAAAVVLLSVIGIIDRRWRRDTQVAVVDEVVDSHVRSLLVDHLSDVASTDRHEVKPWFNGKLDYAPVVNDLAARGFPLIGGRLDFIDHRPVAALVYGRRKHVINLFCWPTGDRGHDSTELKQSEQNGFHLVHWTQGGLQYWAVSDLNAVDLAEFARLVQETRTEPSEN